jgi:hypothetical protein
VSESLPPLLRVYQLLSAAATPLAPTLLSHRLKRARKIRRGSTNATEQAASPVHAVHWYGFTGRASASFSP